MEAFILDSLSSPHMHIRVVTSVTQAHPLDSIELPPQLPSLNNAMTEEVHAELMSEEQRKVGGLGGIHSSGE